MRRFPGFSAAFVLVVGLGCGGPKDEAPTEERKAPTTPPIGAKGQGAKGPGGVEIPPGQQKGGTGSSAQ
jgi:hypothetical protein